MACGLRVTNTQVDEPPKVPERRSLDRFRKSLARDDDETRRSGLGQERLSSRQRDESSLRSAQRWRTFGCSPVGVYVMRQALLQ